MATDSKNSRKQKIVTGASITLTALIVIAIITGVVLGRRAIDERAVRVADALPPIVQIEWPRLGDGSQTNARTWLPEAFQDELLKLAYTALGTPDRKVAVHIGSDELAAVGEALGTSGWFDTNPSVIREPGRAIRITGRWRVPVAVIRNGGKDYLIASDGRPMPPVYPSGQSNLPVVLGVQAAPPFTETGAVDCLKVWPGTDLQAGLELLALSLNQPWRDQVAGVDVASYRKDKRTAIVTRRDTRVIWGGRPTQPLLGEASTIKKLAQIEFLNRNFKSIDAGKPEVEIFWESRPMVINAAASAQQESPDQ
ncbi:MAG: hypothetical protein U0638_00395 [Phycisphaerales bacterium]